MRAIVATADGPSRTEIRDVPPPAPAPNEALIAVRAFAVNRGELTLVRRRDGWQPGQDVAGEVVQPAADGSGPQAGERVAGLAEWHGWAEQAAVPAHRLAVLPEGVDFVHAAALPMAGTTAANLVRQGGALLGARVLVTGASGGVGHIAVQLAALGGADVTAVARPERADAMRGYGARAVVSDAGEAEGPFDLVLESVGGASLDAAIARVAPGGALILFGNSSREPSTLDFTAFFGHEEATIRSYFSARHEADAGRLLAMLLDLVAADRLHVEIGFEGSWDRLDEAMDGLSERRFAGKAVLTIS
ncbi:MAG: NADPH:quinone reductase [Solirubrobacteraceae bacterium]|jgi:NADPH:quinone reductase-like Zn-dependent oxidoreductase|nr:NADPH:quinone reductase [Solirubrobacteraceae bacterium]